MAISYPVNTPTNIGIANITLMAENAVAISQSPFTFQQQVVAHPGQRWAASISLPPMKRQDAESWVAFLLSLYGQVGTFLLSDPNCPAPRGTATSATLTGTAGSTSPTITMTGTLLAGDYISLGSGSSTRLHKVVQDRSGNGTIEIWPALRESVTDAAVDLTEAKGRFRLKDNITQWSINEISSYGITFDCVEAL
jgi:hypothetical protein